MSYDSLIEDTFPEHWPTVVSNLSVPYQLEELKGDDLFAFSSTFPMLVEKFSIVRGLSFSPTLLDGISNFIKLNSQKIFVKTSYGMFKENPFAYSSVQSLADFHSVVKWPDSRISRYTENRLVFNSPLFLILRPWRSILPWSEFRLFIRDRKVIGVSQYHHQEVYPEIHENLAAIKASMIPFSNELIEALHMDTVVADVFVEQQEDGSFTTTLIELNPFIWRTDPCLYSWENGGDFDGGIRYCKPRHNQYSNSNTPRQQASQMGVFREKDYRRS